MARAPILPANRADPTGVDRLERGAMREFDKKLSLAAEVYVGILDRIPAEPVVNRSAAVDRYIFRLDSNLLSSWLSEADIAVDAIFLQGGSASNWFFGAYVGPAYRRGTAQQFANLANQSSAYRGGRQDLASILRSEPYRRRISLVAAREWEEMKGLSGQVKADMARVLTDGVGRGLNPRAVARNLRDQVGIEEVRAHRIARTEIPTALRRARLDEADDARETYGLRTLEMHISALSPTTRITHAARHANLYTTDQQRDWWSQDANSTNCKCGTVSVMVDADGKPVVPAIVERAKQNRQVMKAKGKGPWAKED